MLASTLWEPAYTSLHHFFGGVLVGLLVALPVGPVALLCIQYALHRGLLVAFWAALGAALADTCFALVANFGLKVVIESIFLYRCWIQLSGGALLLFIGSQLLLSVNHAIPLIEKSATPIAAFLTTFLLTLSNPLTIFGFLGLFSYLEMHRVTESAFPKATSLAGVFIGSMLWWNTLSLLSYRLSKNFSFEGLKSFQQIVGAAIVLFGIIVLLKCL